MPSYQVVEFKKDVLYGLEHGEGRFLPFVAYWKANRWNLGTSEFT